MFIQKENGDSPFEKKSGHPAVSTHTLWPGVDTYGGAHVAHGGGHSFHHHLAFSSSVLCLLSGYWF